MVNLNWRTLEREKYWGMTLPRRLKRSKHGWIQ